MIVAAHAVLARENVKAIVLAPTGTNVVPRVLPVIEASAALSVRAAMMIVLRGRVIEEIGPFVHARKVGSVARRVLSVNEVIGRFVRARKVETGGRRVRLVIGRFVRVLRVTARRVKIGEIAHFVHEPKLETGVRRVL